MQFCYCLVFIVSRKPVQIFVLLIWDNAHAPQIIAKGGWGIASYHPADIAFTTPTIMIVCFSILIQYSIVSEVPCKSWFAITGSVTELEQGKLLKCELNARVHLV